jgi:hypothetical protein
LSTEQREAKARWDAKRVLRKGARGSGARKRKRKNEEGGGGEVEHVLQSDLDDFHEDVKLVGVLVASHLEKVERTSEAVTDEPTNQTNRALAGF